MSTRYFTLRDDQNAVVVQRAALSGNVIIVAPTGFGKTVVMGHMNSVVDEPRVVIAHRRELVAQLSKTMAGFGIFHTVVAAKSTIQFCIRQHIELFGRSFVSHQSNLTVAGVDTLMAQRDSLVQWGNRMRHWMIDECHHVLADNKWGRAISLFPRAQGTGFTATPLRADRKSLARSQGGLFDHMVVGPSMREVIDAGNLCDYRVYAPPISIDRNAIQIGSSGDFVGASMRKEVHDSQIVGDVVSHYLRIAKGKRGITFAVDVDHALEIAKSYNDAGVPAECVTAKTPDAVRDSYLQKLANGSVLQLTNVDLFGEGVDVPAVEVVSMARPSESLGLVMQQMGRALRKAKGKTHGIIIDHVGNVRRHGLPDTYRKWRLQAEERGKHKKRDPDDIPITTCTACFSAYPALTAACPYCGHKPEPAGRTLPKQVDGDLEELTPQALAALRGEIDKIDGPAPNNGEGGVIGASIQKNWRNRQEAQSELRDAIALWAGVQRDLGRPDSEIYRRFYFAFGTDIMTAQTLGAPHARKLKDQINDHY